MQDLMPPVDTPDNLFHDGDDSTGVVGTVMYSEFMNNNQSAIQNIQQEMKNVLANAGFTPDPTKHNQLLLSIQKILSTGVTSGLEGVVRSINDTLKPDSNGNLKLTAANVGALASGGTAAAATKLATARKIAGHPFDGTADIAISAGDVGALASGGTAAAATKLATAHKIAGHAFDGTADIAISAGDVGALASGGTAAAATKLATAHKIAGHAFDGTADISISSSDVGLGNVGNYIAVQQGGGDGMATNKIYIGWTGSKVKIQVDASDMGEVYTTENQPPITTQAITAVRLGASYKHASTNNSSGSVQLVNGEVVTGAVGSGGCDFNKAEWFVRPIQYFINGSWITATSA